MEYYSAIKEQSIDKRNNLDESQGNCTEWEKANLKGYKLHNSIYVTLMK